MKKSNSYLIGILLTILFGTYLNYRFCCHSPEQVPVNEEVVEIPKVLPTQNALSIVDKEGSLNIRVNENFNFNESSTPILQPLAVSVDSAVASTISYFEDQQNRNLIITGLYSESEINTSIFPNLGLARANAVKNYFVSQGMSSRRIDTQGQLVADLIPNEKGVLFGPVNYHVQMAGDQIALDEEMAKIAEEIKGKPITLYFETGESTLQLTEKQQQKAAMIARYLDKVEESTCLIVGHTDNTGTVEGNVILGQDRANFARDFFIRNHISSSKVTSISKGQSEPIAPNDTDEGRAKNRRIVVTIN